MKRKMTLNTMLVSLLIIFTSSEAHADIPFAFLLVTGEAYGVILAGIIIEAAFLKAFFGLAWRKACIASFVVNLVSTLIGFIGYFFLAFLFWGVFSVTVGGWIDVAGSLAYFPLLDTVIELSALRLIFKVRLSVKRYFLFWLANLITVGLVIVALSI
jgi:hypothetical protein